MQQEVTALPGSEIPSFRAGLDRFLDRVGRSWHKFSRNKLSVIGLGIVLVIILVAMLAPVVSPYPNHAGAFVDFKNANKPPLTQYLLGSDNVGRDILSRIFFAFGSALVMGVTVLVLVVPFGTVLGLVAGYYQGTVVESIIMRITDVFLGVPPLILALAVSSVLKPTLTNAMIAVAVMWWPWYTRLVFGMATSLRNEFYVRAAELTGASRLHILFGEMLPNCISPIFTKMTLDMGWVILIGASLSFVGLGEQPPKPALGTMVSDGSRYLPDQWWVAVFPAIAIMIIVLGFNLMGDGVRDMFAVEES